MRVAVVAFLVLFASSAAAQSTGSSFGGSDWSESSSSSSGGSSSTDWSSDSSGGGSGSGEVDVLGLMLLVGACLVIFVPVFLKEHLQNRVTIRRVSVGVGPTRRAEIQKALHDMMMKCDPSDPQGRRSALRNARRALGSAKDAWAYETSPPRLRLSRTAARKRFEAMAKDLRSRFRHETTRRAGHVPQGSGPEVRARAAEGVGFCVVSVLVAYRRTDGKSEPKRWNVEETLRHITGYGPDTVVAVEIIWSPSNKDDRMSSAELEVVYPELARIPGASVGATSCPSCRAVYASELGECPTCGAPR